MSLSWEPGFSEDQLREYVEAQKEEDRKVIDGLEIGLAQADNKIGELEGECEARAVALLTLATENSEAIALLQRCRSYLARFPVSAYDEHLQREIADYIKRVNDRLSGPQKVKKP